MIHRTLGPSAEGAGGRIMVVLIRVGSIETLNFHAPDPDPGSNRHETEDLARVDRDVGVRGGLS